MSHSVFCKCLNARQKKHWCDALFRRWLIAKQLILKEFIAGFWFFKAGL